MDQICDETTRVYSYSNGYRIRFDMKLARVLRKKNFHSLNGLGRSGPWILPRYATKKSPTWNIGSIFLKFVKYLFLQQESILLNEVALFPNDHIFSLKNFWKTDPKMPWNGFLRNDKMFSVKVRRAHGNFKTKVFCWEFLRDIGGADLVKLQFKGVLLIGKFVATCGFCIVSAVKILWEG